MTVAALPSSIEYLENGVSLAFPVPFRFKSGSLSIDRVLADGTIGALTAGADYSVTGGSTDAGGTVLLFASTSGARLRIKRVTPRQQSIDYTTGDTFPAETHESGLDTAMLVDQEQDEKIDDTANRAFMVPDGETAPPVPARSLRVGFVGWDAATGGLVPAPTQPGLVGSTPIVVLNRTLLAAVTGQTDGQPLFLSEALRAGMFVWRAGDYSTQVAGDPGQGIYVKATAIAASVGAWVRVFEKIRPEYFGATGGADDTTALQRFAAQLGNGVSGEWEGAYNIASELTIASKDNWTLRGPARIKIKNGTATGYGKGVLRVSQCKNWLIEGLSADGNRANRTPAEDPAHLIIVDRCSYWTMRRVRADNGTCDGFIIFADGAGPYTYDQMPHHFLVDECHADGCYRQGLSIIDGRHWRIRGGSYNNTSGLWDAGGTGPCAGIDLESDDQPTWPVDRIAYGVIDSVSFEGNQGPGLLAANINGSTDITVRDCKFIRNKKAAIEFYPRNSRIINPFVDGWDELDFTAHVSAPTKRGCIDCGVGGSENLQIEQPVFVNVANGSSPAYPLIYTHGGAGASISVEDLQTDGSASMLAALNSPGARFSDSDVSLLNSTQSNAVSFAAADAVCEDNRFRDVYQCAVYMGGARSKLKNNCFDVRVADHTAFVANLSDGSANIIDGNYVRKSATAVSYGIGSGANSYWTNNRIEGITTDPFVYGATPKLKRGNTVDGVLQSETAIAP